MILVDYREEVRKGMELLPHINRVAAPLRIKVEKDSLPFGDVSFEGNGPDGPIYVGIERKKIGDMLNCIEDARYSAGQLVGMKKMYGLRCLIIEGTWKPDTMSGYLMEWVGQLSWRGYKNPRLVRYSKLFRYLLSVQLSGVVVIPCLDIEHTAFNIVEVYQYFRKKWDDHTSLLEVQKLAIPTLDGRPSLVRRWATDLDGIGVKFSQEADHVFPSPIQLAQADERQWLRIPGISVKVAQEIVSSIWSPSRRNGK